MVINKFEIVDDQYKKNTNSETVLPRRGTQFSAGYDISIPEKINIYPHTSKLIWTDIKCNIKNNEFLVIYIRSSIGIKKHIMLSNIVGIIDKDYCDNKSTGGNIGLSLYNYGETTVCLEAGERVCQGIFHTYDITNDDDPVNKIRTGGFGSTGIN